MTRSSARRSARWWSGDAPPWERWPDVSIRLEAVRRGRRIVSTCGRFYFDEPAADHVVSFFQQRLFHFKGALQGKPFDPLPWQKDLVLRPVFGWKRCEDKLRRFRTLFLLVGKKNGKSLICSGVGLYLLGPDNEPGAEIYSVARDRPQAGIVFKDAATLALESPELMRHYDVFKTSIVYMRRGSTYRVLDGRAAGNHGWNIHGLLFDEFHEQTDMGLYDTLRFGSIARRQPLHVFISTAGVDLETPCGVEYERAKDLIAGRPGDERFLPVVFESPKELDWTTEAAWRRANPSLGHTIQVSDIAAECEEAKRRPSKRNAFLQLILNRWGESREPWLPVATWDDGKLEEEPGDVGELVAVAGVDLSSTQDLAAVVEVFRRPLAVRRTVDVTFVADPDAPPAEPEAKLIVDYELYVKPHFWIPEKTLRARVERERLLYDQWAREGWLQMTAGGRIDYRWIRNRVLEMKRKHPHLREVAIDPWNATDFTQQLEEDGVLCVEVRQGYRTLTAASKLLEALVMDGLVKHDGNPVMRWCVGNCELRRDVNDNIMPMKPKQRWRRIDGVAALVTALSRLMVQPEQKSRRAHVSAV